MNGHVTDRNFVTWGIYIYTKYDSSRSSTFIHMKFLRSKLTPQPSPDHFPDVELFYYKCRRVDKNHVHFPNLNHESSSFIGCDMHFSLDKKIWNIQKGYSNTWVENKLANTKKKEKSVCAKNASFCAITFFSTFPPLFFFKLDGIICAKNKTYNYAN